MIKVFRISHILIIGSNLSVLQILENNLKEKITFYLSLRVGLEAVEKIGNLKNNDLRKIIAGNFLSSLNKSCFDSWFRIIHTLIVVKDVNGKNYVLFGFGCSKGGS